MEELQKNKLLKILFIIFIVISAIHVLYASITCRGMYAEGAYYMLKQLNCLSTGTYQFAYDPSRPRFCVLILTQLPIMLAHILLFIKNKFVLMFTYSFFQFAIPLGALYWSYILAKRTNKIDIFFWNLLTYGGIILLYEIFSVTESIQAIPFHFILWNYLTAKMDYSKKDIFCIIFLVALMFGPFEYGLYLGIIFFFFHFYYMFKEESAKNRAVKTFIGFGSLAASLFTIFYMIKAGGAADKILHLFGDVIIAIPQMLHLNTIITIAAILLLFIFAFKKTQIKKKEIFILVFAFYATLGHLLTNLEISLVPMWEGHFTSLPCFWLGFVFLFMHFKDMLFPDYNIIRWQNLLCIALLCTISQTFWQITNTFYWNKNIQYMKAELAKTDAPLYIADEHEEISSFTNKEFRRYIWHCFYAVTSIIFSNDYEQKTLLVNYDKVHEAGNETFRNLLYVPYEPDKISLPVGIYADLKTDFWDLTECAEALDKYNKENNIETNK